ncbi:MAG TPA: hypothetical protein VHN98_02310 [Acidimicrobiales bacterium]|nr:hypothetical protein [Acidimicrobiales bacterium]
MAPAGEGAERARLAAADGGDQPWRAWGPYVSERAWGTVREDYSADGDAWRYFPHDHARSRAYRWSEDGLAGVCDADQTWCLALALWNGVDPILKERIFGLSGPEGNHGEDAKEYWWYLDSTPTHSWMRWRYHYPHAPFPYDRLVAEAANRSREQPEFELADTGVFDDGRYWIVTVDYAKAAPDDLCMRIRVHNHGDGAATLHVLPTLWFRNTWSWGRDDRRPTIRATGDGHGLVAEHHAAGTITLTGDATSRALLCDNETNSERLWGVPNRTCSPKDGIGDHVVHGAATVDPGGVGTKGALHHVVTVEAGATAEIRVRLAGGRSTGPAALDAAFATTMAAREAEADEFYASLTPATASDDEALVLRQALAGLLWSKQYYGYSTYQWLEGDPAEPTPPADRWSGRNSGWRHLYAHDVISMPDKWEYPWFAAWDLAFHCIALAVVDPSLAKQQLLLMCSPRYQHPNGQLPAYEWSFGDVNPPVHAAAVLAVFEADGATDTEFLERAFHPLIANFTWWVNRKDPDGNGLFEGGFLGLDNIGVFDRSMPLPTGLHLEQADSTGWMVAYALAMYRIATTLALGDRVYEDAAVTFLRHALAITVAARSQGPWDDEDGFFYDTLRFDDGRRSRLRVRSMVGLVPLLAVTHTGPDMADGDPRRHREVLSLVDEQQLRRLLARLLDPSEFLSPHGIRSVSAYHRDHPVTVDGHSVSYEPAESRTAMFGGNSNWRGPVWFPLNYLLVEALRRFGDELGEDVRVDDPAGSGTPLTLHEVADDLTRRLVGLFLDDGTGSRPVFGSTALFRDEAWRDLIPFHEYFHGDSGAGLGASHQTGWTALVAPLILWLHRPGGGR